MYDDDNQSEQTARAGLFSLRCKARKGYLKTIVTIIIGFKIVTIICTTVSPTVPPLEHIITIAEFCFQ